MLIGVSIALELCTCSVLKGVAQKLNGLVIEACEAKNSSLADIGVARENEMGYKG